jgi:hypothetical protein
MQGVIIAIIVLAFVSLDALIVWALFRHFLVGVWGPLAGKFPRVPEADGAVRRDFQSFSFGLFNLGYCVHVTVDEDHMHLDPALFLRVIGARAMSIPWERIELRSRPREQGYLKARVDQQDFRGPAWCLRLASPDG